MSDLFVDYPKNEALDGQQPGESFPDLSEVPVALEAGARHSRSGGRLPRLRGARHSVVGPEPRYEDLAARNLRVEPRLGDAALGGFASASSVPGTDSFRGYFTGYVTPDAPPIHLIGPSSK
jgi:hypothetical protein